MANNEAWWSFEMCTPSAVYTFCLLPFLFFANCFFQKFRLSFHENLRVQKLVVDWAAGGLVRAVKILILNHGSDLTAVLRKGIFLKYFKFSLQSNFLTILRVQCQYVHVCVNVGIDSEHATCRAAALPNGGLVPLFMLRKSFPHTASSIFPFGSSTFLVVYFRGYKRWRPRIKSVTLKIWRVRTSSSLPPWLTWILP